MTKTLDEKLAALHANPVASEAFILADAKDADMAYGLAAPGVDPATGALRSLAEYRDQVREIVAQGLVDIMLMSISTSEQLTVAERIFDDSRVTPAIRANDTTDIHFLAGATYPEQPSRPFRTTPLDQAVRAAGADLGLYSVTPLGDAVIDVVMLEHYRAFRLEAERENFRHFLEVFVPNVPGHGPADVGRFLADFVARTLAAVPRSSRPVFLKMPYLGPTVMEALASYDPHLVPGILGGSSGTTHDAFALLERARRHGARAALFGRKIKDSEHPLTFVEHLRLLADGQIGAEEACRSYHAELTRLGLPAHRTLEADLELTEPWAALS
jgi:hypothetical protein